MKVAIVHDYLIDFGGAERVLLALHEIYPEAPIYVSIYRKEKLGKFAKSFEKIKIIESWFGKLPYAEKLISPLRFLLPVIWSSFNLSKYDLIIDSSAWAITRGFKKRKEQVEICYCHTPPRYLYGFDTSRSWNEKWYGKLIQTYAFFVNKYMRLYDYRSSQKIDFFIANSKNVEERIKKYYKRDSIVIYPPVETKDVKGTKESNYFLAGGRLVASKNFDLIIKACIKENVKLKIFGTGILETELKKISNGNIEFLGKVEDDELFGLYKNAEGFIAAQKDEDFGITIVEAESLGCPIIAYCGGGYLETVTDRTGVFFKELKIESIAKAINKSLKTKWNKKTIKDYAENFSKNNFKREMIQFVEYIYARTPRS